MFAWSLCIRTSQLFAAIALVTILVPLVDAQENADDTTRLATAPPSGGSAAVSPPAQPDVKRFKGIYSADAIAPSHSAIGRLADFSVPAQRQDTEVTLRKGYAEYRQRGLDQYLETTTDTDETKQKLSSFARSVHADNQGLACELSGAAMYKLAHEFADPKVMERQDPLVLIACGNFLAPFGESELARACGEMAIRKLRQSNYPSSCALQAYAIYVKNQPTVQVPLQGAFSADDYVESFYYWIKYDLHLRPEDVPFVGYVIWDFVETYYRLDPKKCDALIDMIAEEKDIPEYFRALFEGLVRSFESSSARGTNVISRVEPENLRIFEERGRQAIQGFERAWTLNQAWVMPAMMVHNIQSRLGNEEAADHWFDLGTKVQYDDWNLRINQLTYKLPRWGGSVDEMMTYGLQCYDEGRFDTRVPFILIEAVVRARKERANGDLKSDADLSEYDGLAQKCMDCFDRLSENYATTQTEFYPLWYQIGKSLTAYDLGDYATARQELEKLGDRYSQQALVDWRGFQFDWKQFKALVYARGGPTGELAESILEIDESKYAQNGKYRKRVTKILDEAIGKAEHPLEKQYWDRLQTIFDWQCNYRDDKPVSLDFRHRFAIWAGTGNCRFKLQDDGILIDNTTGNLGYDVTTPGYFPGPKIVDYDFETLEPVVAQPPDTDSLFQRHLAIVNLDSETFRASVGVDPVRDELVLTLGGGYPLYQYQLPATEGHHCHVRLFCDEKYLEAHVNGQLAARIRYETIHVANKITLMGNPVFSGRGSVQYKNIKVQKWIEGAPPNESDVDALFEYYSSATERRPEDGSLWFNVGVLAHKRNRFEEAESAFAKALELGLPHDFINFYLGDIEERRGQTEKAFELYRQSVCSSDWQVANIVDFPRPFVSPREWAAFRCRWLLATLEPQPKVSPQDLATIKSAPAVPPNPWMAQMLSACEAARQGDFAAAAAAAEAGKSQAPAEFHAMISRQINSYGDQRAFVLQTNEKSYYLDSETSLYWPIVDENIKREMLRLMQKR